METWLKALGPSTWFRYGGGAWADAYNWQTNVDTYAASQARLQSNDFTLGSRWASNALDYLDFPTYMDEVNADGAQGMVTINYGSGTPALAAAWAAYIVAHHDPVTEFNIGNEPYGCGEVNFPITGPPTNYPWEPNTHYACPQYTMGSLPGMALIAQAFIAHGPEFMNAIKAADPNAVIVLPYAISPPGNSGYVWNDAVMPALRGLYQGIDVLWYPSFTTIQEPDAKILSYLTTIPVRAAAIKADIAQYAPGTFWMIGETNSSNKATLTPDKPLGAVFAAGDALSWLAEGAKNVDWWQQADGQNTDGALVKPSYSMFDSEGNPQTPYWGYLLASKLAQPGALLSVDAANTNPSILAFRSTLANGQQAEAYVNLSTTASESTSAPVLKPGAVTEWQYSNQNPTIVQGPYTPLGTMTVPPESVTVLVTQ